MRTLNVLWFQTVWAFRDTVAAMLHDLAEWVDN